MGNNRNRGIEGDAQVIRAPLIPLQSFFMGWRSKLHLHTADENGKIVPFALHQEHLGEKIRSYTTGSKMNAKSGREEEKSFKNNRDKKVRKSKQHIY